jgi:hypothetical protein
LSIPFLLDKKTTVVPVGSAGERSGGARKVLYGAARSNSERAAPSACVGKRFWLLRSEPYDGKPILETYDISRLTFGGMEQTLRRFDRRLEIDEKLQQTCLEYFGRTSILNVKAYRFLGEIIPLRNYIIHPSPRESDESSEPIFKIYEKVIKNVKEYLELLSQRELKIYPEVISIESFVP